MTTDLDADEEPSRAPIRVSADGVFIRKIPSGRGENAVVVDLTLRSSRDDTCRVRIEDPIPEPLRGNPIEFHPRYDPANWTEAGDTVVYEAPIGPGVVRRTVYGVVVDDLGQVDLFRTPPAVELREVDDEPAVEANGDESFEFGPDDGSGAADSGSAVRGRAAPATGDEDRDSVVESLFSELRHRELSRSEREALREALGLESAWAEVDELREAVRSLEDRADDLEAMVEEEVQWRTRLRRSLLADPNDG